MLSAIEQKYLRNLMEDYQKANKIKGIDFFQNNLLSHRDHFRIRNQLLAYCLCNLVCKKPWNEGVVEQKKKLPLSDFNLPGRFQKVTLRDKSFIFIGAHNVDGVRKLMHYMMSEQEEEKKRRVFLVSFSDRSIEEIVSCLEIMNSFKCVVEKIYLTHFEHLRAAGKDKIQDATKRVQGIEFLNRWDEIFEKTNRDQIYCIGSYYFISDLLP